jgi:peptidoglycan/LPS O-acetylase OafA/YrhL
MRRCAVNPSFLSRIALLRWLAALVAVCFHVRSLVFAEYGQLQHKGPLLSLFYFVTSLGHEAFVVYMVLGGLLLGGLSWKRWESGASSAWGDLSRKLGGLYMLLVPVLLAGGVLDMAGSTTLDGSGVYSHHPQFAHANLSAVALAGNLLLLQDILVPGFGSNAMLFLLAYEWWAYLVTAVFWQTSRLRPARGLLAAAPVVIGLAALAPAFPGFLAAWLAGLAVARCGAQLKGRVPPQLGVGIFLGALLASRVSGAHLPGLAPGVVVAARIALDLLVALALGLMLLSLFGDRSRRIRASGTVPARAQRWLARLSLPVYASHIPVALFTVAAASSLLGLPLHAQPSPLGFGLFAAVIGAVYLSAYLVWTFVRALQVLLSSTFGMRDPVQIH